MNFAKFQTDFNCIYLSPIEKSKTLTHCIYDTVRFYADFSRVTVIFNSTHPIWSNYLSVHSTKKNK